VRFWARAAADPNYIALVDPSGVRYRAGDLLFLSRRLGRGLRDLGMGTAPTTWRSIWP
jgi:hypothetical protein